MIEIVSLLYLIIVTLIGAFIAPENPVAGAILFTIVTILYGFILCITLL
jgi:hypothetical protein